MSDHSLADLSPETRALVEQIEQSRPMQFTPEFTRIRETLLNMQVCTSLSDEDATARANVMPSGTSFGWVLSTDPKQAPVPCDDNPDTHRHMIFDC